MIVIVPEYWPIAWEAARSTLSERLSVTILHHSPHAPIFSRIVVAQEIGVRWLLEFQAQKVQLHFSSLAAGFFMETWEAFIVWAGFFEKSVNYYFFLFEFAYWNATII